MTGVRNEKYKERKFQFSHDFRFEKCFFFSLSFLIVFLFLFTNIF